MKRQQIIDRLVVQNHTHCCDCLAYKSALMDKDDTALKRQYVMEFGAWSPAWEQRLRKGDVEAMFEELTGRTE